MCNDTASPFYICYDHVSDELIEGDLSLPAKDLLRFSRVSQQLFDLGRTEVLGCK